MSTINIREFLDNNKTSSYQFMIISLMFLTVIMDGIDVAIMGFLAPELKRQWAISNIEIAPVLGSALFGLAIGAMIAGPIADKFGRKLILVSCVFTFGLFTLLGATSHTTTSLIIYRFIAGVAMGGVMPQAATLISEYSPAKHRSLFVTIVFAGFTVGAASGGFIASWLIPHYGWRSVLVVCGIMPMMLSVLLLIKLPESISFMVLKNYSKDKVIQIVNRIKSNTANESTTFILPQIQVVEANPIKTVLNQHYIVGSICLWLAYFFALFLVYLLGSWLPTIIEEAGFSLSQAAIIAAIFQLGGPLGSVTMGWLMDRYSPHKVLACTYTIGAAIMALMSYASVHFALLSFIAFFVGFCFNGANTGMNALSSLFFPTSARATGNSWMHGIGRVGAILSAYAGAFMLDAGWGLSQVLLSLIIPAVLISCLIMLKKYWYQHALSIEAAQCSASLEQA
ncbi:aromatic acid/H+ symport family MFS transporter [Entomomonas sp. E2T0]|uniref:MFS transporter n=1 Tax=Entomomonas sp. E2T0 TaxID=2930213 RepID=UPI0022284628|nr:aromatic acid/H+ symport family MFS transporter [Entomomonas sp. E2T0]UYZ83942.1 aromatic acid/H+ symport family MFS transporter [Entomomonas sp. E2T0]